MQDNSLAVISCQETVFFRHVAEPDVADAEPRLCQLVLITIANRGPVPIAGRVTIAAGGHEAVTRLEIASGVGEYACFGPTLWPHQSPESAAPVRLDAEGTVIEAATPLGYHRPWTVFLLSDTCTDCTWVYDSWKR